MPKMSTCKKKTKGFEVTGMTYKDGKLKNVLIGYPCSMFWFSLPIQQNIPANTVYCGRHYWGYAQSVMCIFLLF